MIKAASLISSGQSAQRDFSRLRDGGGGRLVPAPLFVVRQKRRRVRPGGKVAATEELQRSFDVVAAVVL